MSLSTAPVFHKLPLITHSMGADFLRRQRLLTAYGFIMIALMLPTVMLALIDERMIRGVSIWAKPLKFMAATALFSISTAWFMELLPSSVRASTTGRTVVWMLIITSLFEVVYISVQAALGAASHYNVADKFHAAMFGLMAGAAVLLVTTQLMLAWLIFKHSPERPITASTWGVIVGLVLTFVLSTASGFMLGGNQPPAGAGLMIAGWHLSGGDVRPAHFLGVHGQQIIPLAGIILQRFLKSYALAALVVFSFAYVAAWMVLAKLGLNATHFTGA